MDGRTGVADTLASTPLSDGDVDWARNRRLSGLHTALVCDVLDSLGHREMFLGPGIASVYPVGVVVGRAFTMAAAAVEGEPGSPYRELLAAYGHMSGGDVIVIGTGGERRSGLWGELLTVAAMVKGVQGVVLDGLVRDVAQTEQLGFPVFACGASPLDSQGRLEVYEHGEPVRCGDAVVSHGDFILGDRMGVVVVPRDAVDDALDLAEEKKASESVIRQELARGANIADVFSRYKVL